VTEQEFDAAVMASGNVDMIGDSRMEYDGPRCPECDAAGESLATCPDCGWERA
jgi:hypothetical protein